MALADRVRRTHCGSGDHRRCHPAHRAGSQIRRQAGTPDDCGLVPRRHRCTVDPLARPPPLDRARTKPIASLSARRPPIPPPVAREVGDSLRRPIRCPAVPEAGNGRSSCRPAIPRPFPAPLFPTAGGDGRPPYLALAAAAGVTCARSSQGTGTHGSRRASTRDTPTDRTGRSADATACVPAVWTSPVLSVSRRRRLLQVAPRVPTRDRPMRHVDLTETVTGVRGAGCAERATPAGVSAIHRMSAHPRDASPTR